MTNAGKFKKIIALLVVLLSSAVAHAASSSTHAKKVELVKLAKKIIAQADGKTMALHSAQNFNFLNWTAHADENEYDCLYAGWPSQSVRVGDRRLCSSPARLPGYQAGNCSSSEMRCNPVLFGDDLCVDASTRALKQTVFARCEQSFQKSGGDYSFLKQTSSEALEGLFDLVESICEDGSVGFQSKTGMCRVFIHKKNEMKQDAPKGAQDLDSKDNSGRVDTEDGAPEPDATPVTDVKSALSALDAAIARMKSRYSPSATDKKTPGTNEDCPTCGATVFTPNVPADQVVENETKLDPNLSIKALYEKIKSDHLALPECHRHSVLPPKEKAVFLAKLYGYDVNMIAAANEETELKDAFSGIAKALNWSDEVTKTWVDRAVNAKGDSQKITELQVATMGALIDGAADPAFETRSGGYIDAFYRDYWKLRDCAADSNDFVSYEAFEAAYLAKQANNGKLAADKKNLITILDRSLGVEDRRAMTIDMNTGKILFHGQVSFGDGVNGGSAQAESAYCSNRAASYLSPVGAMITTERRTSDKFLENGEGVFVKSPEGQSRGVAFHKMSNQSSIFNDYFREVPISDKFISLKNNPTSSGLSNFLASGIGENYGGSKGLQRPVVPATDGCVGVDTYQIDQIQDLIGPPRGSQKNGGAFVYFHCPKKK